MHEKLEILGFLSRWGLICLAVVAVAGLAAACFANAGAEAGQTSLVMSDSVWNGVGTFHLDGLIDPPVSDKPIPHLMGGGYGQSWDWAVTERQQVWMLVPQAPKGVSTVAVRGVPYGAEASVETSCRLLVVPGDRRLFLLDVRLAGQEVEQVKKLMAALQAAGEAAMFTGSTASEMNSQKEQLRANGLYSVLVSQPGARESWLRPLAEAARHTGRAPRQVEVITGDPLLAVQAAGGGYVVDLVAPSRVAPATMPSLRVYESVTKLQAQLAERSINP